MFGSPTRKGLDKNIFSIHPRRQSLKVLKNRWVVDPYDSYDFVQQGWKMQLSNKTKQLSHPNTMNKEMYGNEIESASEIIM